MKKFFIATNVYLTVILSVVAIDIPSPPEILEIVCKRRSALLSWSPTGEQEVNEYNIQYMTNWSKDQWIDYGFKLPLKETHVRLILSPWANYTFRVIAINNAGASNYSTASDTCVTEEDIPHKNPEDVYGRGNGPKNLVISWKPMPPFEQNAPGFFYKVFWRLKDVPNEEWHHKNVLDWQQHRLVIENLPKLRPYRIKVEAHNSLGPALQDAEEKIGFSDEDRPSEAPKLLRLVEIIDGKSATLEWEPVPPMSLNGHFKGYKVQVWTDSYENKTEQIVGANITKALIDIFTPGKINNVQVLAFNGAFDGPASNAIEFQLPEDVYPDPPAFVWTRITDQNNKAVIRITYEPNVTNGNPGQKIYIQFRRKGIDVIDEWQNTFKESVEETPYSDHTDLVDLEFDIFYEIRVVAESGKLRSYSNISTIDTGSKKWPKPSTTTTPTPPTTQPTLPPIIYPNPDKEYKAIPSDDNAGDSGLDNKQFQPENPESTAEGTEEKSFSKTPWFIALIVLIAFICVFVGVFIFLKRRRTGGSEVNRNNRVKTDKIRTTTMTANKTNHTNEPNERNSFIIVDNRNGSVGHDEGDEFERHPQNREVYNGTTENIH